jgi:hypothetical protein
MIWEKGGQLRATLLRELRDPSRTSWSILTALVAGGLLLKLRLPASSGLGAGGHLH